MTPSADNCLTTCHQLFRENYDYYFQYYHERPMIIGCQRVAELRKLHSILYKCLEYMAYHYEDYLDSYMPLSEQERAILAYQSRHPFRATTYRPDYLISTAGQLQLCEITSRFFAHGIFYSYYAEAFAEKFMQNYPGRTRDSRFNEMLQYMLEIIGDKEEIFVLKSADRTSEIRMYQPFYQYYGKRVTILEAEEVEPKRAVWQKGFVISALNQKDLLSFQMETIKAMIDAGMYNDFRTIFLAHDKRFMRLWFEDNFTQKCLTPEETAFLRAHAIPTYCGADQRAGKILADAYANKDNYILKHYRLGKSEKVYAGPLTKQDDWQALFADGAIEEMIIQPFISQRTYKTVWNGRAYDDYICGMMLCVDDKFFDSGMFRASSCPVTNRVDDRKICAIASDDAGLVEVGDIL